MNISILGAHDVWFNFDEYLDTMYQWEYYDTLVKTRF